MSKEEMRNEKMYKTTMLAIKKMLDSGLITKEEYCEIDTIFLQKYKPIFGGLSAGIMLTNNE